MNVMIRTLSLAAALLAGTVGFAQAQTLAEAHGGTIDLGSTRGSAYYVNEPGGYHLVATLITGGANGPVRFDAVLADGQSATVSIPGPAGAPAQAVTFRRSADRLDVRETPDLSAAATQ
jgi:hypothetical protein